MNTWGNATGNWNTWGKAQGLVPGARRLPGVNITPQVMGMPSQQAKTAVNTLANPMDPSVAGKAKAVGYLGGPPKSVLTDTSQDGYLTKPGTGEQWFQDHQNEINAPSKMDTFLPGATGRLMGLKYAPDNATTAFGQMTSELGAPTTGVKNSWDVSQQLRQATPGEGLQTKAAGMLGGPNLAHDYATEHGYEFNAPGAAETNLGVTDKALSGINFGAQGIDATKGLTGNAGAYFGSAVAPGSLANTVGDESKKFLPGLENLSNSEQLYNSGDPNLDMAYQRANDKAMRQLSTRMAATGMFGSGTNARGMEEIYADSVANQARDRASLAAQADQAHLGRTGAALSFADASGKERLSGLDLGMRGASAADESARGNVNTILGATKAASDEALGKVAARTTAATSAEQNQINRLLGGSTVAATGDKSMIDQATGLGSIGHNLAGDEVSRLATSSATGIAGDAQRTAQLDTLMKGATSLDDLVQKAAQIGITREQVMGSLTNMASTGDQQRITDAQGMANDVQHLFEGRNNTMADNLFRGGNAQANLVTGATGALNDEQTSAMKDYINGQIKAGAMTQQQGDQLLEELLQGGGLAAKFLGK